MADTHREIIDAMNAALSLQSRRFEKQLEKMRVQLLAEWEEKMRKYFPLQAEADSLRTDATTAADDQPAEAAVEEDQDQVVAKAEADRPAVEETEVLPSQPETTEPKPDRQAVNAAANAEQDRLPAAAIANVGGIDSMVSDSNRSSLENQAADSLDPRALQAPHRVTRADPVTYEVVVPTYQRWKSISWVTGKRRCRRFADPERAFILDHTLRFLSRQCVPKSRVTLFVADDEEARHYREALQDSEWAEVRISVSAPGIRDSRNTICKYYAEGTYVVSVDDDLDDIFWKAREGCDSKAIEPLPPGAFERLIFDAYQRMRDTGAFLWGLNTSANPYAMAVAGVSSRNGLVNGYMHGFICRPQCEELLRTLCDAVEDCEFSVRHFKKDGIVLRYRMYAGSTLPFANGGGLQAKFRGISDQSSASKGVRDNSCSSNDEMLQSLAGRLDSKSCARKLEERRGAEELHRLFPSLIAAPGNKRVGKATMSVRFIRRKFYVSRTANVGGKRIKAFGKHAKIKLDFLRGKNKKKTPSHIAWRDEDCISYGPNLKKEGSQASMRYDRYRKARTIGEARKNGAKREDFLWDTFRGQLTVTNLDTTPSGLDCKLQENVNMNSDAPTISSARPASLRVRVKEMDRQIFKLKLPRDLLVLLSRRCGPAVQRCPASRWGERDGPLASVPLDIVRILLHWAKTGTLVYSLSSSIAVSEALVAVGANDVAMRARCCEVASGQASLARFWPSSGLPGLSATTLGSKTRGKCNQNSSSETIEADTKNNGVKSLAHYFGT